MDDIKPIIEESLILDLLTDTFDQPISELAPIESGHIAKVFSFRSGEGDYVLHFNKDLMGSFQKEKFIYDTFASPAVPIPPILRIGEINGLYFSISQKISGRELDKLSKDAYFQTLPSNMATLLAIHQSDVSRFSGYSWMDEKGNGQDDSLEAIFTPVIKENPEDFYGHWHTLFDTHLDRAYFEMVYEKMISLIPSLSSKRYLIHRDYEYNNVLAEDGKVTAVIDWGMASYGDFVYDIAYLDFWKSGIDIATRFRDFYAERGMDVSNFAERFACHTLYIGLDGMRFCAKTGSPEAISNIQQILEPHLA